MVYHISLPGTGRPAVEHRSGVVELSTPDLVLTPVGGGSMTVEIVVLGAGYGGTAAIESSEGELGENEAVSLI
jgi:hypothetical protein